MIAMSGKPPESAGTPLVARHNGTCNLVARGKPGKEFNELEKTSMKRDFIGGKFTAAIWRFKSCIAELKAPAAMWSAACEELLHHDCVAVIPSVGIVAPQLVSLEDRVVAWGSPV